MPTAVALDRGRTAFAEHRWGDAFAALTDADSERELPAGDLERLSTAAFLVGQPSVGIDAATRAHKGFLAIGDATGAARSAAWLGMSLMSMGDSPAKAAGWFARAGRVLEEKSEPSSVDGLLLIPVGLGALYGGDPEGAAQAFDNALAIGNRFHDPDLMGLAELGLGQAKIMRGTTSEGLALLDEAMVAVTAGEIAPLPSGIIYCGVIGTCHLAFDLHRAQEWTVALDRWCGARPDMVLFSGQCQTHRAQLYFMHGAWAEALGAARAAQKTARRGDRNATYGAWYQQGEIQRLRGKFDAAEESYRQASLSGYEPQPGLALLRLAQGKTQLALSIIRDAVDPSTRRQLLPGLIEIEIAAGEVAAARRSSDELGALSNTGDMPMVQAIANQCEGAVLLEEGDARGALNRLRRAWALWQELDAPYEAARCRVLAARAHHELGDADSAVMEVEAARAVFAELGAGPALIDIDAWSRSKSDNAASPLTRRELEVLRLISRGKTNRAVAAELYLSEKTVARHLSNMYTKLGLPSRSAATAYAYEHGLA